MNKIFGLGLSKTGTTSLTEALNILGYKSAHYIQSHKFSNLDSILDAVTDTPVPIIYKYLDRQYPNSKFILTVRNHEDWLESFNKHIELNNWEERLSKGNLRTEIIITQIQLYGSVLFDRENFLSGYKCYYEEVLSYFSERKDDLLILDIYKEDAWTQLCNFLNKPIPEIPFPHKHSTKNKIERIERRKRINKKKLIKILIDKAYNKLDLLRNKK